MILEHLLNTVDRRLVVHRVDNELAVQQGRVQRRELVKRNRQHYNARLLDSVCCPSWLSPWCQHLRDQLDLLRVTRSRDRHVVARLERDPRDDRTHVTRPEPGGLWQPGM